MSEQKNQEILSLDRLSQLEKMGVRKRIHAKMIFTLECAGYKKEARAMLYAATNLFISYDLVFKLFQKYYVMLMEQDSQFCI
jgi:hypothetical protein